MTAERYYVQKLTEQIFLVRERTSVAGGSASDDRIVRSFDMRHDAYMFVESENDKQKKLDENEGHLTQRAAEQGR